MHTDFFAKCPVAFQMEKHRFIRFKNSIIYITLFMYLSIDPNIIFIYTVYISSYLSLHTHLHIYLST